MSQTQSAAIGSITELTFKPAVKALVAETWPVDDVMALFELPFNDLMFQAQQVHRTHFPDGDVELATLLSIKTGGCEEDCAYCPQADRYDTGVKPEPLKEKARVLEGALAARAAGSTRAARSPRSSAARACRCSCRSEPAVRSRAGATRPPSQGRPTSAPPR